jgi:hypothetical protein
MSNARESAIKRFCRLAVSKANPGVFEAAKRWGSCLTASLRHSTFQLLGDRLNHEAAMNRNRSGQKKARFTRTALKIRQKIGDGGDNTKISKGI